jgi:serine/threonine protein kinase
MHKPCDAELNSNLCHSVQDHGPLQEADVARIMHEALQTVATCHQHSLYHGDVKPANFMLRDEARPGARGLGLEK